MATQIDRLQTVIMATGQSAYRRAMATSSASVAKLGIAEALTAGQSAKLAAAQQGAAVAASEQAAAETGAAVATTAAGGAASAANIAIAALTVTVTLAVVAFAALTAATALLAGGTAKGLVASIKSFKDFESVMKDVELQSGATAKEMAGIEAAALSRDMTALGKSGTDVGEAFKRLASEGFSVVQMREMMQPIIRAAIILGEDEAEVTRLMINLMYQFGLEATDMVMISDLLTNALAGTSFQGDELVAVMKFMGVSASSLGWNLQQTIPIADALMKRFGEGTMAGTRFRAMVNALRDPSDKMANELARVGISLDDVSAALKTPEGLIVLLGTAMDRGAEFAKLFESRALDAAEVLARESIPALEKMTAEMYESGTAIAFAEGKMDTLEGAIAVLVADFEVMKTGIGKVTRALSIDLVKGASLATRAFSEAFTEYINLLKESQGETLTTRDVILETALAIVEGMGLAAESSIVLLEVWKKLAVAASTLFFTWVALQKLTPAGALAFREITFQEISDALYVNANAWREAGEASEEYRKHVKEVLDRTRANVHRLRQEMEKEGLAPGEPAELAAKKVLPIMPGEEAVSEALAQQVGYRRQLGFWIEEYKALSDSTLDNARAEVVFRQYDLQAIQNIVAVLRMQEASQERIVTAVDNERRARIALLQAEQRLRQDIQRQRERAAQELFRAQQKAWKEADRERLKTARDYDRLIKKGNSVRDAIQAVIGGTLGRGIQEAIGRVSGAGLGRGLGAGAVRAISPSEIRVTVDVTGLADEGKREITKYFTEVLEEGARMLPGVAY